MHILSDEQLMDLVVEGDGLALDSLYQRFANSLTRLAQRVVHDRAAAEEIVQETFWRVWKNAESFNVQRGSFRNWVHSINQSWSLSAGVEGSKTTQVKKDVKQLTDEIMKKLS